MPVSVRWIRYAAARKSGIYLPNLLRQLLRLPPPEARLVIDEEEAVVVLLVGVRDVPGFGGDVVARAVRVFWHLDPQAAAVSHAQEEEEDDHDTHGATTTTAANNRNHNNNNDQL